MTTLKIQLQCLALLAGLLFLLPAAYPMGSHTASDVEVEAINKRIQPLARVVLADDKVEQSADRASMSGEALFKQTCAFCHDAGIAGAPKRGDKAAWKNRITQGLDGLLSSVIAGKGAMPPRGGASAASDEELARAIAYLANQAGADFTAP